MPDLMPLQTILTAGTGNRLDFFNIGGLARQRTQESLWGLWNYYSWREIMVRSSIVTATVIAGI
ncbi:MAG: hypothetical protein Q8R79_07065, partial [Legionellaceae bacterium]|nr:hypothetical protein [Legionellaceae bacterium]